MKTDSRVGKAGKGGKEIKLNARQRMSHRMSSAFVEGMEGEDWEPFVDLQKMLGQELFAVDSENFEHVLIHLKDTYAELQGMPRLPPSASCTLTCTHSASVLRTPSVASDGPLVH